MISLEFLFYALVSLLIGMLIFLYSIKYIFEGYSKKLFISFFPFSMGILGLIPFLISNLTINKLFLDGFFFIGSLFLFIEFYLNNKGGGKND